MTPIAVFLSLLALSLAHPQHAHTFEGRKSHLDGRIFGGNETTIQKYPYMVSLRDESDELYESHMCGGSIISENFVVTAGHCCTENTTTLAVRVGNADVDQGEKHELSKITQHPDFYEVDTIPYNDICLLKVSKAFVYSDSIKPVKLSEANSEVSVGTLAVTAGWGATSYDDDDDISENLREVSVPIVSHSTCVTEYGENTHGANFVNDTMICAGYLQGGKDACQGDSGGPLIVSGTLVGLVSWGKGCAQPKYPGVYTNVAYFREWLKKETSI